MNGKLSAEYIKKLFLHPSVTEYGIIKTDIIPFSEAVVEACRANVCGLYGTKWTCPPGVGELGEIKKKLLSYPSAVVLSCKYDLEDSFDYEGMLEGMSFARKSFEELRDKLREDGIAHYALGCEGCNLCKKCTYPDAPCLFPDKATPSVEACGIHVGELAKKVGIKYNNGPNTVTYFCIILFNEEIL